MAVDGSCTFSSFMSSALEIEEEGVPLLLYALNRSVVRFAYTLGVFNPLVHSIFIFNSNTYHSFTIIMVGIRYDRGNK